MNSGDMSSGHIVYLWVSGEGEECYVWEKAKVLKIWLTAPATGHTDTFSKVPLTISGKSFSSSMIKMLNDKDVSLSIIFLWKESSYNQLSWLVF